MQCCDLELSRCPLMPRVHYICIPFSVFGAKGRLQYNQAGVSRGSKAFVHTDRYAGHVLLSRQVREHQRGWGLRGPEKAWSGARWIERRMSTRLVLASMSAPQLLGISYVSVDICDASSWYSITIYLVS